MSRIDRALVMGHELVEAAREFVALADRVRGLLEELDAIAAVPLSDAARGQIRLVTDHLDALDAGGRESGA